MKTILSVNAKLTMVALFICFYTAATAQAKLIVNGAKINMAKAVFVATKDISLAANSTVTVDSSTIKIAGTMASAGSFNLTNGTVETNGSSAQVIPANVFAGNVVKSLTVNNLAGVTMQGSVALTNVLTLGSGSLASNGYLTLKSTSTNTARVAQVTSAATTPVSGDVIVERYIPAKRAYRLLTAPVTSSTSIKANWMENTNNPSTIINYDTVPGYGTHISGTTGNTGGFDVTSTMNPSMFTYDIASQTYLSIPNTSGLFTAGTGYRIIVRGSRSTNLNSNTATPSATTLRAKGSLFTGTMVMTQAGGGGTTGAPQLSGVTNAYTLIGNPYASVLDWNSVQLTNISTTITVFDPTINGANGRGAFVTYNGTFNTNNTSSSAIDNNLQSGQAFFVQTTGSNPSISIKETHKASALRNVFRTANIYPEISVQLLLPTQLNTTESVDGCKVFFSRDFPSAISAEDSYKFANQDENLGVLVQDQVLSIEGRQPVAPTDTVLLKVWQLKQPDYAFRVNLTNFDPSVLCSLRDNYLQTNTLIKTSEETIIPFSINADTASSAANRFSIVFESLATLPVEITSVNAYEKNKGISVDWIVNSESNIKNYVVEKSATGETFAAIDSVLAKQSGATITNYSTFDGAPFNGDNYYRIKAVEFSGAYKYSKVVKVSLANSTNEGTVTAATLNNQTIQIVAKNLKKAVYNVTLFNSAGSLFYKGTLNISGNETTSAIKLSSQLPAGIYQLHVEGAGNVHNVSILTQ